VSENNYTVRPPHGSTTASIGLFNYYYMEAKLTTRFHRFAKQFIVHSGLTDARCLINNSREHYGTGWQENGTAPANSHKAARLKDTVYSTNNTK